MNRFFPAAALLALAITGCDTFSTAHVYCARADECLAEEDVEGDNEDSDDGRDDVAVCTKSTQASFDALRANSEPECAVLADAYEGAYRCLAEQSSCDELFASDLSGCDDEEDALTDALETVNDDEIDCESIAF